MKQNSLNRWAVLGLAVLTLTAVKAQDESIYYNTFKRISGVSPNSAQRQSISSLASQKDMAGLAKLALDTQQFGYITALSVAERICNRSFDEPWNDCTWSVASGIVLDEDMRLVLWGDKLATSNIAGLPAVAATNNNHYNAIPKVVDVKASSVMSTQTQSYALPADSVGGFFTYRKTASEHLIAGTNRKPIETGFLYVLGVDLKDIKDPTLPKTYIGGDVVYHDKNTNTDDVNCLGCHAGGLDAMRGAFAYLDFVGNQPRVTRSATVVAKYARNATENNGFATPSGYVTVDDRWENYYKSKLGFRANPSRGLMEANLDKGNGVASLALALSETSSFSKHLARLAMDTVCNKPDYSELESELGQVAVHIEQNGYKLKEGFIKAAQIGCVPATL